MALVYHCSSRCRTTDAIKLLLLFQICYCISSVVGWASPKPTLGKGGFGQKERLVSVLLFSTHRRRKRDFIRQTLQRVIPGQSLAQPIVDVPRSPPADGFMLTERPQLLLDLRPKQNKLDKIIPSNQTAMIDVDTTTNRNNVPTLQQDDENIPACVTDTLKRRKNSLYKLPETAKAKRRNDLEEEFHNMLVHFAEYTEADVLSIVDPRKRVLFEGIAASANSAPVYRAFEVLFEDLLPLRLAGRVLFRKLRDFMDRSVAEQEMDIAAICERTGLGTKAEREKLEELRLLFLTTASKYNKDNWLSSDQIRETGFLSDVATRILLFDSTIALINHIDKKRTGKLEFVDLVTGLWDCVSEICGIEECDPQKVLYQLLVDLNRSLPGNGLDACENPNDQRNRRRYDDMVAAFIEWKDFLPAKNEGVQESRRMDVIRGCFVGAEIPGVVDALRVVYMDYRALRIAGDFIFAIVAKRMNSHYAKT